MVLTKTKKIILVSAALSTFSAFATSSAVMSSTAVTTAQDQSTKPADAEITRKIRQGLMSRDLSLRAKNVTIVTESGMVTLKGTVATAAEKRTIQEVATSIAPNVRNDIVVK